jgi:hypothetical protein
VTLEELKEARSRLIAGQHVVSFRSANGKSVTYNAGDLDKLEAMIRAETIRASGKPKSRSRQMISSKGL